MNKIFKVFTTTQDGNLAYHVGDIKENVDKNREKLAQKYGYKNEDLVYMNHVRAAHIRCAPFGDISNIRLSCLQGHVLPAERDQVLPGFLNDLIPFRLNSV